MSEQEEIKVIRKESCPSLSGSSTITYEIGCIGEQQYIRLAGNSGGGLFCKEWVKLDDIQQILSGCPKPTTRVISPLYVGKSSNSAGFLLACILNENLAKNAPPKVEPPPKQKKSKQVV